MPYGFRIAQPDSSRNNNNFGQIYEETPRTVFFTGESDITKISSLIVLIQCDSTKSYFVWYACVVEFGAKGKAVEDIAAMTSEPVAVSIGGGHTQQVV